MRQDVLAIVRRFAPGRRASWLLLAATLAQSVVLVPVGLLVADAFGTRIPDGDRSGLVLVGAAILVLYLCDAALRLVVGRLTLRATVEGSATLRGDVAERLHGLPVAWHAARSPSALHAAVMPEVERVEATARALLALGPAVLTAVPLAVLATIISPPLAIVVAVAAPTLLLVGRLAARRIEPLTARWQDAWVATSRHLDLGLRTIDLTRTRGAEGRETSEHRDLAGALSRRAFERSWAMSVAGVAQGAVSSVSGALVLVVGGLLVVDGSLELSRLLGFYAVLALLLRQVAAVSGTMAAVAAGLPSYRTLMALLDDAAPPPYSGRAQLDWDGSVALAGISFGYEGHPAILDGFDLEVAPGEHVALVGPNGSGKSTVASLVVGLQAPQAGEVRAGGVLYARLDLPALRRRMGVVPQRLVLRPGTLADNVGYGLEATPAELDRAAELAGLGPLLADLPDGWSTVLEDESVRLSGGEAQRISLARALVGRPRLLVLDEPTNHLDADAVAAFVEALATLEDRPAILTVTHDRALSDRADRVVVLEGGRAVRDEPRGHVGRRVAE